MFVYLCRMEKERITAVVGPKLKKAVEKAAKQAEMTVSQYVAQMIAESSQQRGLIKE